MSTTKVATSPGAKNVFSAAKICGMAGGRRFRSCSVTGGGAAIASQHDHRRHSTVHGPSNGVKKQAMAPAEQHHHYHRQRNSGGGGGGGGGGTGSGNGTAGGMKRRAGSFSLGGPGGGGQYKRRKKEPGIVPPTKFLLGGNINDPLNLNSFEDEEANRAINQVTPYSSPLPTPAQRHRVAVLIPPNINDPLNLNGGEGDIELNLVSPNFFKKRKKKRKRKASAGETTASSDSATNSTVVKDAKDTATIATTKDTKDAASIVNTKDVTSEEKKPTDGARNAPGTKCGEVRPTSLVVPGIVPHRPKKVDDKIVSPVIPQPGMRKHRPSGHARPETDASTHGKRQSQGGRRRKSGESGTTTTTAAATAADGSEPPDGQPAATKCGPWPARDPQHQQRQQQHQQRYRYGNYDRYYGYRNPGHEEDYRLSCMRRDWLEGRDVLDLGCNIGHVTLSVARDFSPRRIVGVDIDSGLIRVARKNVTHYVTAESSFPISMAICYGPITTASHLANPQLQQATFPNNVVFVQGNYVFESDDKLDGVVPEYDTILCLSLTKWIHLNWGDDGLKRFFKRIFRNLRPGGRLILEPQNWLSYSKKIKRLLPCLYENYLKIRLKPEHFTEYLLSKEVGFSTCEVIDTPFNRSKGFQRPMQLFTKSETSPSSTPSEAQRISQKNSPASATSPPTV